MTQPNYYFNAEKRLLVLLDENYKPVMGYSGKIALDKYREVMVKPAKKPSRNDLLQEIELCKSVLLNQPDDLPADIRSDYQKRYRVAKKMLEQFENKLIKK